MILTRHAFGTDSRWAVDGQFLAADLTLSQLLKVSCAEMFDMLKAELPASGALLAPLETGHEVWASGVTYRRSLVEREAESVAADVYGRVYEAARPEIFFKSLGWRVSGHEGTIRIRRDSDWNVPEPELTLVINAHREIVGYTAGNDVSSRSIEGENPLYLPQAKSYDGSCALGPGIVLTEDPGEIAIALSIHRGGEVAFSGKASTAQMKRSYDELTGYLFRETTFPIGTFLMTGTGIVPGPDFTLQTGDLVSITVGELTLENPVG